MEGWLAAEPKRRPSKYVSGASPRLRHQPPPGYYEPDRAAYPSIIRPTEKEAMPNTSIITISLT